MKYQLPDIPQVVPQDLKTVSILSLVIATLMAIASLVGMVFQSVIY